MMFNRIFLILFFLFFSMNNVRAQFVSREAETQARSVLFQEERGPAPYVPEAKYGIAVIVNGEIVTVEDINNRMKALSFNTGIPLNAETAEMMKSRVLSSVVDEKIKQQEATKEGMLLSNKEIDEAIENFARGSLGITSEELYKKMESQKVSLDTFREQIKSDILWVRLVRKKAGDTVEPSQKEITRAMEQIKKETASERFFISEIVISKKTAKNLKDLVHNLRSDPRFVLYAMQFSESPSASKGGSLGWVAKDKLHTQLQNALSKMSDGDVSDPIEIGDNYHIVKLEKKQSSEDGFKLPSRKEVRMMLEGKSLEDFASSYINKLRQKSIIEIKE